MCGRLEAEANRIAGRIPDAVQGASQFDHSPRVLTPGGEEVEMGEHRCRIVPGATPPERVDIDETNEGSTIGEYLGLVEVAMDGDLTLARVLSDLLDQILQTTLLLGEEPHEELDDPGQRLFRGPRAPFGVRVGERGGNRSEGFGLGEGLAPVAETGPQIGAGQRSHDDDSQIG
jgi:hypothetical protein